MAVSKTTSTAPTLAAVPTTSSTDSSSRQTQLPSQLHSPTHQQLQSQTVHTYETILNRALLENNRIAKIDISTLINENDVEMIRQIATAKMLNYCIRMLHADGWHPPTILRAMALRESGLDRSIRGTMYQALRERRKEIELLKFRRMSASVGAETGYTNTGGGGGAGSGSTQGRENGNRHGMGSGAVMRGRYAAHGNRHSHSHGRNMAYSPLQSYQQSPFTVDTNPNLNPRTTTPTAIHQNSTPADPSLANNNVDVNTSDNTTTPCLRSGPTIADGAGAPNDSDLAGQGRVDELI